MEVLDIVLITSRGFHALNNNIYAWKDLPVEQHHAWMITLSVGGPMKREREIEVFVHFGDRRTIVNVTLSSPKYQQGSPTYIFGLPTKARFKDFETGVSWRFNFVEVFVKDLVRDSDYSIEVYSDGGYEYDDDGDYECYNDSHDQEANGNESYYFGGEIEKNGDYSSYDEEGEDEECHDPGAPPSRNRRTRPRRGLIQAS
uniref:Uncharacterized protein n=1 Tax=Solanum tuberosum TaxID=4113 RepID=M1DNX1_SOLTU